MRDQSTAGAAAGTPAKRRKSPHRTHELPTFQGWLSAPPHPDEGFCTAVDAAEVLGSTYRSLRTSRTTGQGRLGRLPFWKVRGWGSVVLYRVSDLEAFVAEHGRLDSKSSRSEG